MKRAETLYRMIPESVRQAGAEWYEQAQEACVSLSRASGRDLDVVTRVVAAMSPRCSWSGNLTKAARALSMEDLCEVSDLPAVMVNLRKVCRGEDFGPRALKISAFAAALGGDEQAVTVDSWMSRAFGGPDRVGPGWYRQVEAAIRKGADRLGLTPRTLQATIWLQVRGGE